MGYTSYQCPECCTEVKMDLKHVHTTCPVCGKVMTFHRSLKKTGVLNLHMVVDTSASIRRSAVLPAMQETMDKICQLFSEQTAVKILCYRCGRDEVKIFGENWRPSSADCGGIAPMDCVFTEVLPQVLQQARQRHMVIVLSDGYWCGNRDVIAAFEHDCLSRDLALLAEINLENNGQWNFSHPGTLRLRNTDSALLTCLSEAISQF